MTSLAPAHFAADNIAGGTRKTRMPQHSLA